MKKIFKVLAVALLTISSGAVFAQNDVAASSANATNQQSQGNTGFNNGQGQSQGQNQGLTIGAGSAAGSGFGNNNSTNIGSDLSESVGFAQAPALTTTLTETCMGSTSVGGGFSGGSFSFGTTWRDHACVRRLDAREIKSFGDIQAAKEIMCDSDLVREAFKRVGRPCAEDGGTYVAVSQPEPTPPPAVEPTPMPAPATDRPVRDDQDLNDQSKSNVLQKADTARQEMRLKYGF